MTESEFAPWQPDGERASEIRESYRRAIEHVRAAIEIEQAVMDVNVAMMDRQDPDVALSVYQERIVRAQDRIARLKEELRSMEAWHPLD